MKWVTLLKDFKDKVGLTQSQSISTTPSVSFSLSSYHDNNASSASQISSSFLTRDTPELGLDFKRFWEEFRSSSSEKEKEAALNLSIGAFCRLVKQHANVAELVAIMIILIYLICHLDAATCFCMLVETHIFSFVVGRAFVTDIEKLKISSKTSSLDVTQVLKFFSEATKDGISQGANLLASVEILVSGPRNKQSLLDSGIFCCLIHVLNALLDPDVTIQQRNVAVGLEEKNDNGDIGQDHRLEVEGSVVHIMKALASHPPAAQSLAEDDSLQLLFQMVAKGSLIVFSRYKEGLVPLHIIQLHRHAMQILVLLLVNDNGSTAKYIHKHHLIKVLLLAVKDFDHDCGDSGYTVGIVDLLLKCVELSYKAEAGSVRLQEDIHNAHGYQFLVQFALTLSNMTKSQGFQSIGSNSCDDQDVTTDRSQNSRENNSNELEKSSIQYPSPTLSRLLDVLVSLAQTGPNEFLYTYGDKGSKSSQNKKGGHDHRRRRSRTLSSDWLGDELWEKNNGKIKDLEAVQMLQDILLKANRQELQAEVLNRLFKIFSAHLENYKLCQQLRTVPLLILNMGDFPSPLQEMILKILEYVVTVVNCVPEQELLSLCCLLQQPITSGLKQTILSFFVKLLSFDQQYKKVLREVGVLEVMLDDLKQHRILDPDQQNVNSNQLGRKDSSSNFKKHLDKDVIITSPKLMESSSGKFLIFEVEATIAVAWDCMLSLLKKAEGNQASFRSANGVTSVLPFLVSDVHRQGVLRILSCLIIEDTSQAHPEELSVLVETLKSGMVSNALGSQYRLSIDAKCDTMGALWRILGVNNSAQKVFGEATGFSLLLTTLHGFQSDGENFDQSSLNLYVKVFTYLLRVVTAGVFGNAVNRMKLHAIISSQTFFDLLCESGLLCVEHEQQVIQLMLELALEIVIPPILASKGLTKSDAIENESSCNLLLTPSGPFIPDKERVYNADAVRVLIRALLLFTPMVQLKLLDLIDQLARAGPFNQENLTSIGCVELLLEIIHPFLMSSSRLLPHALKIVEVLGSYRLSASELRMLIRYVLQMRLKNSGHIIVEMMENLILMEDMDSESISLAPFVEIAMSKIGHAAIQVSLGERSWPPAAGYTFACWFQFQNFLKSHSKDTDPSKFVPSKKRSGANGLPEQHVLRIFSVGATNNNNATYTELYLQEDGVLNLATSNSSFLSLSGLELEEGRWHHLAVIHSKPNSFAGLFQASVAYVYLNGKLIHTGKLGYSPSPAGTPLQVTIGTSVGNARVSDLTWKLRSCYLFEEVLTPGCICFMYILGRGYRGIFQDTDLLQFVPNQACGGGSMAILDSLDADLTLAASGQRLDSTSKQGDLKADGSGIVWDLERLGNLSLQLSGKKLIFAFDGTSTELVRSSSSYSMLNLVDPMSAAASPIGGIPRFGRLSGDIYICKQGVIGETIRPIGGMELVLALVEAAETADMLHMALTLLACVLHQNPQNLKDMQTCRGYHLLALFLRRRMSLFDMQSLEIFFQIAACEASFSEPKNLETTLSPVSSLLETSLEDQYLSKFHDENPSVGSHGDVDDFYVQKDSFSHISELENTDIAAETSNCIVLSNADMVEHVLLDWTLWVTAPVSIQISLLGFLENLVSMHWYRNHNLTVLRRINLVQHLLVTLQRGDVEVPVLEKLVVLLGVILEDGFLSSELENVVRFVIMTFDPPRLTPRRPIMRESMGKHVIVRNMLLEVLIDLQDTIKSEDLLEQWHKVVSSKLITYFLDEAVHPTSMRWIMTLLGMCITSSPTFALKFRTSGGYQGLVHMLPSFYDSPDIYYILFCLIFGKPVYPRLPEVRMLDFHALMAGDGSCTELKYVELLESVIAMAKTTFDRVSMQSILAHQTGNISRVGASLVAGLVDGNSDLAGDIQGEALMHKTYAARLMGGEASAPAAATSVLRFMVDLAKMCPPFTAVCRRTEFLESCIDLYFSCVRAAHAVKIAKDLSAVAEEKTFNYDDDTCSSQNTFSSLPLDQDQSIKTSISVGSFPQGQLSTSSDDMAAPRNSMAGERSPNNVPVSELKSDKYVREDLQTFQSFDGDNADKDSATSSANEFTFHGIKGTLEILPPTYSKSSPSFAIRDSPVFSEKSSSRIPLPPSSSPVVALTSWLGSANDNEAKSPFDSCMSPGEFDPSSDLNSTSRGPSATNGYFAVTAKLLLDIDDSGYGGGPCSQGATAVLDFIAEVLSDFVIEQVKASQVMENILESIPLYVDGEAVLIFQGLCLSRFMNFLERRLMRDDDKSLDNIRWPSNLDALCWMIVDRVYMGAFPQPSVVLKTLEFFLSMLQLANKDGKIEETAPGGKRLLSISRGNKQLEAYIHSILKNTNRMILYCFLPSFLESIGEDDLLSELGLLTESKKRLSSTSWQDDSGIGICTFLQLLVAHKRIIFCPSNTDTDLNCCLCMNLIYLLYDTRQNVQHIAIDLFKYLLVHRRAALEDLLVSRPNRGQQLDVLHDGFDKLLTRSLSEFFEWYQNSEPVVNKVLEQCAGIMWVQYIAGSAKFPGVRIKGMEGRRKREMGRKSREAAKLDLRHWEHVNERRYALDLVRDAMSTELRVVRQDKYGWILHAESEWQCHLQQLVHERGIFPLSKSFLTEEPEWQLCPIEGPYRMRIKLESSKLKIDTIRNIFDRQFELEEPEMPELKTEKNHDALYSKPQLLSDSDKQSHSDGLFDESFFHKLDSVKDTVSDKNELNEDKPSSIIEASLHSALEHGAKSSAVSVPIEESTEGRSDVGYQRQSSMKVDERKIADDKYDKEVLNNGEYLIRPFLEPFEKIRFKYNCERVVGLDKHDGIFLIGEFCLYVIENFYIDYSGCFCEKECGDELSVIDQVLGVKKDVRGSADFQLKSPLSWSTTAKSLVGGRAWAYSGGAWGKEKVHSSGNLPHPWRMWKLDSVHEILKRDYQLRPVAVEIFSMDGCNDLLVFHKKEREEVFKNLVSINLPRNSMLDTTISGSSKQEINEGSRLFKIMAKSFSKRWQNGEISNFQYLMHLNTLAGRGYSDLTQYPVFPWVLADYDSENLDLSDPKIFRRLDKPMGCQTPEGEDEFRKRYDNWDDPEVPKFHYGSHYSSAGIVLFYLLRLPPFSVENQKLQGGQFDHADRLFNCIRDTWLSASGKGYTSDVKELIPEFFYMPEFLDNRFNLDLGEKQCGQKVGDVILPPWAKGSAREFISKHREALESDYVSENLNHWIDLIFGHKQRGKAAEESINVFYHYTYEGSVDIDSVTDPAMKESILAQINHFGQTPKQLFLKPHPKRRTDRKLPLHPLKHSSHLVPQEIRRNSSPITQIVTLNDKILIAGSNNLLKPSTYSKYVAWGFPDRSLRFISYEQDRLLSTHENLHGSNKIQCAGVSHDGRILVTGADDGLVNVWRVSKFGPRALRRLKLEKPLCGHTARITCLQVSQPYMLIVSGSDDCTVITWDLSSMAFVRQLPQFPAPVSAIFVNDLTGEIVTAAGILLAVWSINGDCLAMINTSQLPSDSILSVTNSTFSDWLDTKWYVTGHQSGSVKVWQMVHFSHPDCSHSKSSGFGGLRCSNFGAKEPEYKLILRKVLKSHKHPVTAVHLATDLKQLLSGDLGGNLLSWTLPDETLRVSSNQE
ncbi:PREDICTED: protein SPIRRIG-like isoform X2 [Lupinus angustifolius]|uniref:protein SPIRRIG-like isoform X2 n=1 Tax=Lupinus angustifolius TaxID=3871 RepID=UPI00092F9481|nr:PREDICTED: protein SPIRRIG-like isoform X2 [Lupinus angustifolius]